MAFYLNLLLLAALWGASFLFLRISSPEFGPVALVFVRTAVAALALLPWLLMSGHAKKLLQHWRLFFFLGAVSTALPFSLFAYTSVHIASGYTSILNATTPLFSALIAWAWLQERLDGYGVLGLALGFVGVVWLASEQAKDSAVISGVLPVLAALTATSLYAFSSAFAKLKLSHLTPLTVATGSQLYSAIILAPFAALLWPSQLPSVGAWSAALALAIFCTAIALIIFFRLLQSDGVTKTVAVTYLIPLFAVLWGVVFLGERVSMSMVLGGGSVLLGVSLTTGVFHRLRRKPAA